jgi:hypothetical protein
MAVKAVMPTCKLNINIYTWSLLKIYAICLTLDIIVCPHRVTEYGPRRDSEDRMVHPLTLNVSDQVD